MGPPNKVILPDNMDKEVGDLRRRIFTLETAGATSRVRTYNESVDAAHPMYIDFVLPAGVTATGAKLSFKYRVYRTTSSFAGGSTGSGAGAGTGGGSNHSHTSAAHSHSIHVLPTVISPANATFLGSGLGMGDTLTGAAYDTNQVVNSTTPGATGVETSHTHSEGSHTHTVGASALGVAEGTATTISALAVDGVDKTSILGGPWGSDTVNLDVTAVLPLGDGAWHTITLTPAGQGRIVAELKLP